VRWPIRFACLIAGGALVGDAAAKPVPVTVTPPRTCNEVDVTALQRAQIERMGRRARTAPAAETQARRVCDRACAGGDLDACVVLGNLLNYALGGPRNQKRAAALFTAGCDKDHARSCLSLAFAHAFGHGVPQDQDRKVALYQKACRLGDKAACQLVGAVERVHAEQQARQDELSRMSPAARDGVTCTERGDWTADRQAACERACASEPKSCLELAGVFEAGRSVKADLGKAIAYAHKACKLGDQTGCESAKAMDEHRRTGRGYGILKTQESTVVPSPFTRENALSGDAGAPVPPASKPP
jgi:TPR repeat protein